MSETGGGQRKRRSLIGRSGDSPATGKRDSTPAPAEARATPAPAEARPPAAEAPVVQAPVVQAPVVQAPVVQAPVVQAPVVEAAVVEAPVAPPAAVAAPATAVEAPAPAARVVTPAQRHDSPLTPVPDLARTTSPGAPLREEDVDAPPLSAVRVKTTPSPVPSRALAAPVEPPPAPAAPVDAPASSEDAPSAPSEPTPPSPTRRQRNGALDSEVGTALDDFTQRGPPMLSDVGAAARPETSPGVVLGAVSATAILVAVLAWYFLG